ncbi:MAG: 2-C-methyl-D-erythritol 4-phosphate cytidylyltransferase [Magnetococcales bacterium]|nr:2-C-methyl-D-erythritol 4-phosphate cytidylyltransferase [Magnetococcales bacterium]
MSACTMIVLAAGQGTRFGGPLPKQYLPLCHHPLLWHTLSRLHRHPQVGCIVPVIAPHGEALWQQIMQPLLADLPKVAAPVLGGTERQHSVFQALRSLPLAEDDWVGIHDGARPLVDAAVLDRLLQARTQSDAIIPTLAASDTVKQVDAHGHIIATLDRNSIHLAQTPQLFRFGLIHQAHQQAAATQWLGTDDASLVERLARPVLTVPGSARTIKITQPLDWALAEWLLQEEEPCTGG